MKINVIRYEGEFDIPYDTELLILYNTRDRNAKVINMLQLEKEDKQHLVWIWKLQK